MNEARFEQWLTEALATDVQPGDDFTSRVMERVAATPQEPIRTNGADKRKLRRMLTALAACAAIVILVPFGLLMMPKGSEKAPAADGAAMESFVMDDAAADTEYVTNDSARFEEYSDNGVAEPADGAENQQTTTVGSTPAEDVKEKDEVYSETGLFFSGEKAKMVQAALMELGVGSAEWVDGRLIYHLTEDETVQLRELLPELIDAEGAVALTLEVGE